MKENKFIKIKKEDLIKIIKELTITYTSLAKIGSSGSSINKEKYNKYSSEFLSDWKITKRIVKISSFLETSLEQQINDKERNELDDIIMDMPEWSLKARGLPEGYEPENYSL